MDKYSVFSSSLHGCGVQMNAPIGAGEIVLQEKPFFFLQTIPNRKSVVVCGCCLKPLGSISTQIGTLQGMISRENIAEELESGSTFLQEVYCCPVTPCPAKCGEMYCSERCRDLHWANQGHRLLCTGHISDEEADFHPLISFKVHAMSTNEIFLMVADVFAAIVSHLDNLTSGGMATSQAFEVVSRPLSGYCREMWWDAAITPKNYKPVAFKKSLKKLVKDTWELLDKALQLKVKGYAPFLSEEYLSRTVGMFEQNNVGVQMKSPLAECVEKMVAPGSAVDPAISARMLEATQCILDNIDDDAMSCDEEEGAGDGEEDGEEDEEDEEEDGDDEDAEDEDGDDAEMDEAAAQDAAAAMTAPGADPSITALREMIEEYGIETLYPPLDGTAFYSTICRINHSCDPNVRVTYINCLQRGLLASLIALRPIAAGEELVQSYIDQFANLKARQKALKDYGFVCACPKCVQEGGGNKI